MMNISVPSGSNYMLYKEQGQDYEYYGLAFRLSSPMKKEGYGIIYKKGTKDVLFEGIWEENEIKKGIKYYVIEKYVGDLKGYKKEGYGKIISKISNKTIIDGYWKDNELKEGIKYYDYGIYIGEFKNNKREGNGLFQFYKSKEIYDGYWKDDKKDSSYFNVQNKSPFYICWLNKLEKKIGFEKEGNRFSENYYLNNKYVRYSNNIFQTFCRINEVKIDNNWKLNKNFLGLYYYENGDCYLGEWENNNKNGKGIYIYSNGDYYYGNWRDGKMDGKNGKHVFKSSNSYYEGEWKEGVLKQGKFHLNNGAGFEIEISDGKIVNFCEIIKEQTKLFGDI